MLVGFAKLVELVALDPGDEPPLRPTLVRRIPETFLSANCDQPTACCLKLSNSGSKYSHRYL